MISSDIKSYQMISNDDNKNKNKKENKNQNKESESEFIADDAAAGIQKDHDRILDAAQDAGFKGSNSERAGLLNLYAEYGLEKVLAGINECMTHSAPNLAYLTAVLKGTPKITKKAGNYEQRDYAGEQEQAMDRMMSDTWGVI